MKIAILGAGNGGFAASVDLTLRGHEVKLYEGFSPAIIEDVSRISYQGVLGSGTISPTGITSDINEALFETDMILLMMPALGHAYHAQKIAPLLKGKEMIIASPGHTLGILNFSYHLQKNHAPTDLVLGELDTLPYVARKTGLDSIRIDHKWNTMYLATYPANAPPNLSKMFKTLYPTTKVASNVLETSLKNQGAVMHPVGMLFNAGWIENQDYTFCFYYDGFSKHVSSFAEKIDRERMSILKKLNLDAASLEELFYVGGFLEKRTDFYHAIAKSEANKNIPAPLTLQHRFIDEDIMHGLVPMESIARKAGVSCSTISEIINMAGIMFNRDFRKEGVTLEKIGFRDYSCSDLVDHVINGKIIIPS